MRGAGRRQQRGIAALTAILVVAIATVLAVNLLWTTSVDIQRTQTLLQQEQARLYDLGGEDLAKFFLAEDYQDKPDFDSTQEFWSQLFVRQFKDGTLEGTLVDQQGLFDLNSLVDRQSTKRNDEAAEQFKRLLQLLDLEQPLDPSTADELANAAVDWIDPDTEEDPRGGAEDAHYMSLQPPYLPANLWFISISELQAVKGFTPEIMEQLAPHITALPPRVQPPGRWPLNANTATDLVLASLIPQQTADSVASVVHGEYDSLAGFNEDFQLATGQPVPPEIPVEFASNWFLLTVTTTIGTTRSTMYSLLERNAEAIRTRLRTYDAN
jgi:general secretion pathway protein K